jgi:phosphomannomutase
MNSDDLGSGETAALLEQARAWVTEDPDPATRAELGELLDRSDLSALRELFATRLEFGTAGLRGVIGPGPSRMNRLLVRKVGLGLARYLRATHAPAIRAGVVVGHDARHLSPEFAEDTARLLAGQGIRTYLFDGFAPTPLLAYAVRHLRAAAGVMITASHNPPEYNGYKVYWDNGAQIVPPHDEGISREIDAVGSLEEWSLPSVQALRARGQLRRVPSELEEQYLRDLLDLRCHPDMPCELGVVYTPMHGVGGSLVQEVLRRAGLREFHRVVQQFEPDPDFPTVRFPNPEEPGAMDLALELAARERADLVLANDPDADRLAVAVPVDEQRSSHRLLSGNEIGTLLGHYLLTEKRSQVPDPLVMTTIVSSRLLSRMANALGAHYDETLTGFKWIANRAQEHARERGWTFVMGYEEALGYTVGDVVGDKDGIGAALLFTELAAQCERRGESILDRLEAIYRQFGLFVSRQHSVTLPGTEGAARIAHIMQRFRADPPTQIGTQRVLRAIDYGAGHEGLPPSNVLAYHLEGDGHVLLRPSGTEPKIKYYFESSETVEPTEDIDEGHKRADAKLDSLVESFLAVAEERAR